MIDLIISQLKQYATVFTHDGGAQVAGAAQWAEAQDQVYLPQPAAYVVPLSQDAEPNTDLSGLTQQVRKQFGVIVDFDNRPDRRGQTVAETFDAVGDSIFKALLNWRPAGAAYMRGFELVGGDPVLPNNRQRLAYQWVFSITRTLSEADGWTDQPLGPVTIAGEVVDPDTGASTPSFQVVPES